MEEPEGELALARKRVLEHGWNSSCYQILNPGIELWFAAGAVVGYGQWGGMRVAAGAPVCAPDRMGEVAAAFEEAAGRSGSGVCYFGAGPRLEKSLGAGHSRILLGAQPVWNPARWPGILAERPSLRAQLYRARNKGVRVREWTRSSAVASRDLRRCLDDWLARRPMPVLHFLVEPRTLDRLWDRRIFVAEKSGAPVAFLVASPVPGRRGWLIEQIVRARESPNGTAELLVAAAFEAAAGEGLEYFTLGLSPLSGLDQDPAVRGPWWTALVFRWLRLHGSRFYNFRGLERFKAKFHPDSWEPVYAICNRSPFPPRALLAIAGVFGGEPLGRFLVRTLGRALWQETRRFLRMAD